MPARKAVSVVMVSAVVVFVCAALAVPAHAVEMALVPVSASGPHTIVGNEIILHGADQIVTLEIRISDWNPARLRAYQAGVDPSGTISGDAGTLMPLGWDPPIDEVGCADDVDCADGRVCWRLNDMAYGFCAGPNHHPENGAFIDEGRSDYVFDGVLALPGMDLIVWDYPGNWLGFRYGAVVFNAANSVVYVPPAKYGGTLTLVVPPDAAGTFTMRLKEYAGDTYLMDGSVYPEVLIPRNLSPALITVIPAECGNGICDSGEDATSCPEDCGPGAIPAVSTWGLAILGLLLATLAKLYYAHPRKPAWQT